MSEILSVESLTFKDRKGNYYTVKGKKGDTGATGATGAAGTAGKDGKDGKDGRDGVDGQSITIDLANTSVKYGVSNNGINASSVTSWGSTIPTLQQGQFLWTKTTVAYSDGTSTVSYSVSRYGIDGNGISSIVTDYYLSANNTEDITSLSLLWVANYPTTVSDGQWIFTRTTYTYSDNQKSIQYSKVLIGKGSSFAGFEEYYGLFNDNGPVANTYPAAKKWLNSEDVYARINSTYWKEGEVPAYIAGSNRNKLWNFEISFDSDGNKYVTDPIFLGSILNYKCKIETYALSAYCVAGTNGLYPNDITSFTDEWTSVIPTDAKPYQWNKTEIQYNNGPSEITYHISAVKGGAGKSETIYLTNELDSIGVGPDWILQTSENITLDSQFIWKVDNTDINYTELEVIETNIPVELVTKWSFSSNPATKKFTITIKDGFSFVNSASKKYNFVIRAKVGSTEQYALKTFTLCGVSEAEDGVLYRIVPDYNVITVNKNNAISPSIFTCKMQKSKGSAIQTDNSIDGLKLYYCYNKNQAGVTLLPSNGITLSTIYDTLDIYLKKDGVVIDTQSIPFIKEGKDGIVSVYQLFSDNENAFIDDDVTNSDVFNAVASAVFTFNDGSSNITLSNLEADMASGKGYLKIDSYNLPSGVTPTILYLGGLSTKLGLKYIVTTTNKLPEGEYYVIMRATTLVDGEEKSATRKLKIQVKNFSCGDNYKLIISPSNFAFTRNSDNTPVSGGTQCTCTVNKISTNGVTTETTVAYKLSLPNNATGITVVYGNNINCSGSTLTTSTYKSDGYPIYLYYNTVLVDCVTIGCAISGVKGETGDKGDSVKKVETYYKVLILKDNETFSTPSAGGNTGLTSISALPTASEESTWQLSIPYSFINCVLSYNKTRSEGAPTWYFKVYKYELSTLNDNSTIKSDVVEDVYANKLGTKTTFIGDDGVYTGTLAANLIIATNVDVSKLNLTNLSVGQGGNIALSPTATIAWDKVTGTDNLLDGLYTGVKTLYYLASNGTEPIAPTAAVTSISTDAGVWTTVIPTWIADNTTLKYYQCSLFLTKEGTYSWSIVSEYNDSAVSTLITKNTITTDYVNALLVNAKTVSSDWVYAGTLTAELVTGSNATFGSASITDLQLDKLKDSANQTIFTADAANKKLSFANNYKLAWAEVAGDDIPLSLTDAATNAGSTAGTAAGAEAGSSSGLTAAQLYMAENLSTSVSTEIGNNYVKTGTTYTGLIIANLIKGVSNGETVFSVDETGKVKANNLEVDATKIKGTLTIGQNVGMTDEVKNSLTGASGRGISSTTTTYQIGDDGTTTPTGTWVTSTAGLTFTPGKYLWAKTVITYTDNNTSDPSYQITYIPTNGQNGQNGLNGKDGKDGLDGKDGKDGLNGQNGQNGLNGDDGISVTNIEVLYIAHSSSSEAPSQDNEDWSAGTPNVTSTNKYVWRRTVTTYSNNTTDKSSPVYDAAMTAYTGPSLVTTIDNSGVKIQASTTDTDYYMLLNSTSGIDLGQNTTTLAHFGTDGIWLGGTSEAPVFSVDNQGNGHFAGQIDASKITTGTIAIERLPQGVQDSVNALVSDTIYYLATSETGITNNTEGFTTTPQSIDKDHIYLWTYHLRTYAGDKASDKTDAVISGVFGKDGTSVNIVGSKTSIEELNGISNPSKGDGYIIDGNLWIYTGTDTSDDTHAYGFENVGLIKGPKGDTGSKGDSISISYATTEYAVSNQGTSSTGLSWQGTIPTVTKGQYLWSKTTVVYSDGTSTITYGVTYFGTDGVTTTETITEDGTDVKEIIPLYIVLYQLVSGSNAIAPNNPSAPNLQVTSTSTNEELWTTVIPRLGNTKTVSDVVVKACYVYTCNQIKYQKGSETPTYAWTTPILDRSNSAVAGWCVAEDNTYIDGGNIYTGTISAEALKANAINANNIYVGSEGNDKIFEASGDLLTFGPNVTISWDKVTGEDKPSSYTIEEDGYWYKDGVKTSIKAEGQDGTSVKIKASQDACTQEGDGYIDSNGHLQVWDGTQFNDAGEIKGPKGDSGKSAYECYLATGGQLTEENWLNSLVGTSGKSAYEIAVQNGYPGSETEWIASLDGEDGLSAYDIYAAQCTGEGESPLNKLDWLNSLKGTNGKSAYECYVEGASGTPLTEELWLASLVGNEGKSAYLSYLDTTTDNPKMSESEWLESLDGEEGLSAYDIYLALVPEGETALTEKLWLESLNGESAILYYIHYVYCKNTTTGEGYSTSVANDYMGTYVDTEVDDANTWEVAKDKAGIVWSKIKGESGTSVQVKYNSIASDTGAHTTFQTGDKYMNTSSDGTNWNGWVKIVGENGKDGAAGKDGKDGLDGDYVDYKFLISARETTDNINTSPDDINSTAWQDAPVATTSAKPYLWCKMLKYVKGVLQSDNPSYIRLTGEKGRDGLDGDDGNSITRNTVKLYLVVTQESSSFTTPDAPTGATLGNWKTQIDFTAIQNVITNNNNASNTKQYYKVFTCTQTVTTTNGTTTYSYDTPMEDTYTSRLGTMSTYIGADGIYTGTLAADKLTGLLAEFDKLNVTKLAATEGTVGGWNIDASKLYNTYTPTYNGIPVLYTHNIELSPNTLKFSTVFTGVDNTITKEIGILRSGLLFDGCFYTKSDTDYTNKINIDGSGFLAKGNLAWDSDGNISKLNIGNSYSNFDIATVNLNTLGLSYFDFGLDSSANASTINSVLSNKNGIFGILEKFSTDSDDGTTAGYLLSYGDVMKHSIKQICITSDNIDSSSYTAGSSHTDSEIYLFTRAYNYNSYFMSNIPKKTWSSWQKLISFNVNSGLISLPSASSISLGTTTITQDGITFTHSETHELKSMTWEEIYATV